LYFLKSDLPYNRFAISVNRKIGNSVERNYIKRLLKELFRLNSSLLGSKFDLWIVMKKKFDCADKHKIEKLFIDDLISINYENN